jgi:hypothetical protein
MKISLFKTLKILDYVWIDVGPGDILDLMINYEKQQKKV